MPPLLLLGHALLCWLLHQLLQAQLQQPWLLLKLSYMLDQLSGSAVVLLLLLLLLLDALCTS